jgi:uncharacterized membrane protein
MTPEHFDFRVGVIKPVECIKEGWALIKDQYWLFFGITIISMLIAGTVPIVLLGPMMIGLFLCLLQKMRAQRVEFGMLFKGFDQFVPGLVVAAIKVIPLLIIMAPFYIIMVVVMMSSMPRGRASQDESAGFFFMFFGMELVFILVVTIASILIEVLFMFAFPLVADRKLSGLDAVKLSIKAGRANLGGVLGLLLLNALFGFVGVLACIVGVYFYMPIAFASQAIAYRRVFPEVPETFATPPPPPASWA